MDCSVGGDEDDAAANGLANGPAIFVSGFGPLEEGDKALEDLCYGLQLHFTRRCTDISGCADTLVQKPSLSADGIVRIPFKDSKALLSLLRTHSQHKLRKWKGKHLDIEPEIFTDSPFITVSLSSLVKQHVSMDSLKDVCSRYGVDLIESGSGNVTVCALQQSLMQLKIVLTKMLMKDHSVEQPQAGDPIVTNPRRSTTTDSQSSPDSGESCPRFLSEETKPDRNIQSSDMTGGPVTSLANEGLSGMTGRPVTSLANEGLSGMTGGPVTSLADEGLSISHEQSRANVMSQTEENGATGVAGMKREEDTGTLHHSSSNDVHSVPDSTAETALNQSSEGLDGKKERLGTTAQEFSNIPGEEDWEGRVQLPNSTSQPPSSAGLSVSLDSKVALERHEMKCFDLDPCVLVKLAREGIQTIQAQFDCNVTIGENRSFVVISGTHPEQVKLAKEQFLLSYHDKKVASDEMHQRSQDVEESVLPSANDQALKSESSQDVDMHKHSGIHSLEPKKHDEGDVFANEVKNHSRGHDDVSGQTLQGFDDPTFFTGTPSRNSANEKSVLHPDMPNSNCFNDSHSGNENFTTGKNGRLENSDLHSRCREPPRASAMQSTDGHITAPNAHIPSCQTVKSVGHGHTTGNDIPNQPMPAVRSHVGRGRKTGQDLQASSTQTAKRSIGRGHRTGQNAPVPSANTAVSSVGQSHRPDQCLHDSLVQPLDSNPGHGNTVVISKNNHDQPPSTEQRGLGCGHSTGRDSCTLLTHTVKGSVPGGYAIGQDVSDWSMDTDETNVTDGNKPDQGAHGYSTHTAQRNGCHGIKTDQDVHDKSVHTVKSVGGRGRRSGKNIHVPLKHALKSSVSHSANAKQDAFSFSTQGSGGHGLAIGQEVHVWPVNTSQAQDSDGHGYNAGHDTNTMSTSTVAGTVDPCQGAHGISTRTAQGSGGGCANNTGEDPWDMSGTARGSHGCGDDMGQDVYTMSMGTAQGSHGRGFTAGQDVHDMTTGTAQGRGSRSSNAGLGVHNKSTDMARGSSGHDQHINTGQGSGDHDFNTGQGSGGHGFNTGQGSGGHDFNTGQGSGGHDFNTGQGSGGQDFNTGQGSGGQDFNTGQRSGGQDFNTGQDVHAMTAATAQGSGSRSLNTGQGVYDMSTGAARGSHSLGFKNARGMTADTARGSGGHGFNTGQDAYMSTEEGQGKNSHGYDAGQDDHGMATDTAHGGCSHSYNTGENAHSQLVHTQQGDRVFNHAVDRAHRSTFSAQSSHKYMEQGYSPPSHLHPVQHTPRCASESSSRARDEKRKGHHEVANPQNTSDGQFFGEVEFPKGTSKMPSEMYLAELTKLYNCQLRWSKTKNKLLIMADSEKVKQQVEDTLRRQCGLYLATKAAVSHELDGYTNHSSRAKRSSEKVPVKPALLRLVKKNYAAHLQSITTDYQCSMVQSDIDSQLVITSDTSDINRAGACADALAAYFKEFEIKMQCIQQMLPDEVPRCRFDQVVAAMRRNDRFATVDISLEDDFVNIFGDRKMANAALQHLLQEARRSGSKTEKERASNVQVSHFQKTLSGAHLVYQSGIKVEITQGNIVEHSDKVDVIVNAANEDLRHIGGVARAISKAGGKKVDDESRQYVLEYGPVKVGNVACTSGGKLKCKHIIHAVGPRWKPCQPENSQRLLKLTCRNSLLKACDLRARSIALPAISSGIFGAPKLDCANTLLGAVDEFCKSSPHRCSLTHIQFILFEQEAVEPFITTLEQLSYSESLSSPKASSGASAHSHIKHLQTTTECPICFELRILTKLPCAHELCDGCKEITNNACPFCRQAFGPVTGTQPKGGEMSHIILQTPLSGYPRHRTIEIHYDIPSGRQSEKHPNPGKLYTGTQRLAYLPDNEEGRKALRLLKKAFDRRLIFTIGRSVSTGVDNTVIWCDIQHKTQMIGGAANYGYPDAGYLKRLFKELAAKGIE